MRHYEVEDAHEEASGFDYVAGVLKFRHFGIDEYQPHDLLQVIKRLAGVLQICDLHAIPYILKFVVKS